MSTLHCPLCGLRFRFASELDGHVREDHAPPPHLNCPPPSEKAQRERAERERVEREPVPEHERTLRLPW